MFEKMKTKRIIKKELKELNQKLDKEIVQLIKLRSELESNKKLEDVTGLAMYRVRVRKINDSISIKKGQIYLTNKSIKQLKERLKNI